MPCEPLPASVFLSPAAKARYERLHHILGSYPAPKPAPLIPPKPKCPCCGQDMVFLRKLERPAPWQAFLPARAPPRPVELHISRGRAGPARPS